MWTGLVVASVAFQPAIPAPRHAPSRVCEPPVASLWRVGLAVPVSTAALVALNIAQNGPDNPTSLDAVMNQDVPFVFEGSMKQAGTGDRVSSPFTPTDTAPSNLDEMLTLRTKADVVRAWRNGAAPEALPSGLYDGVVLRRGVLSPASSFITHRLFGPGQRWRGKSFGPGGVGCNRFGGTRKNRFGITSSDAAEIERLIREQVREIKAMQDPLMRQLAEEKGQALGSLDSAPFRQRCQLILHILLFVRVGHNFI